MQIKIIVGVVVLVWLSLPMLVCANTNVDFDKAYIHRAEVQHFIKKLTARHGYSEKYLHKLFSYSKPQREVLRLMSKPAERTLNWKQYRPIFYRDDRINDGVKFWQQHKAILQQASKQYGVPEEIIVAILGVETRFGRITGRFNVFDSLATLAFDGKRRKAFFRNELESLLVLARKNDFDPRLLKGSYAGAMGMPQFISSSYNSYAVDFDNNGQRDLFNSIPDIIGSVANYFKRHGWQTGELIALPVTPTAKMQANDKDCNAYGVKLNSTVKAIYQQGVILKDTSRRTFIDTNAKAAILCLDVGEQNEYWLGLKNFYVISRYNHSSMYSMAVYQISQEIKKRYDALSQTAS